MKKLHIPTPRLLPMTMAAMLALLGVKAFDVVSSLGTGEPVNDGLIAAAQASAPKVEVPKPETEKSEAVKHAPARQDAKADPHGAGKAPEKAGEKPVAEKAVEAPPKPAEPRPVSEEERKLLLELRARRAQLDQRESALAAREAVLTGAEARIATRVDELTGLQKKLEVLESGRGEKEEANWRGLVKLYEGMRPRDAAVIFNDLETQVLLEILDRMKEAKAGPVLAAMQPDRARQATTDLAQFRSRRTASPLIGAAAPGGTN